MSGPIESAWRCCFGGTSWRVPRWDGLDTGWRQMPHVLLETPRGGAWRLWTDAGEWRAGPGETLVVGAGTRHRLVAETVGEMRSSWVFVEWDYGGWPLRVAGGAAVRKDAGLARRVDALAKSARVGGLARAAGSASLAFAILADLAEIMVVAEAPDERVGRAMRWANEHLAEPVRRADLARAAGVSEAHLQDLFRAAAGLAPMEYVSGLRIRLAMELLAGGNAPVGEVAERCGFASPFYFSRFFRQKTGLSPKAYRAARGGIAAPAEGAGRRIGPRFRG